MFPIRPEAMSGPADEDVLQARLVNGDAVNFAREGLDHVGYEAMPIFNLQPHTVIQHSRLQSKAPPDAPRQGFRLVGFEQDDIAANLALQLHRRPERDDAAV